MKIKNDFLLALKDGLEDLKRLKELEKKKHNANLWKIKQYNLKIEQIKSLLK